MALSDDERNAVGYMTGVIRKKQHYRQKRDAYYEGSARYAKLGLAIPEGLEDLTTVVNFPRVVADAIEERMDVEGFRLPPEIQADGSYAEIDPQAPDTDTEMWRWWQANDLDSESQLGHLDYVVRGLFFSCVGTDPDDEETPKIDVVSADEMTCLFESDGRTPRSGFRLYDSEPEFARQDRATLYMPDYTLYLKRGKGSGGWVEDDEAAEGGRDEHNFGEVLVTPFANRSRLNTRFGASDLDDAMLLTDAAVRNLTNLQIGAETTALPLRVALGAAPGDFKDSDGNALTQWESYFGAIWTLANEKASIAQFSAADLTNFHNTTMHYARLIGLEYGLPPYYMGVGNDQGPSADSIRASEARLVMRVRRKIRALSAGWERTMRLAHRVATNGEDDPQYHSLEVLWRNPETPTQAQIDDGVVKKHAEGLLSTKDALEDLGYSAIRRARILANLAAQKEEDAQREQQATVALADAMRTAGNDPEADPVADAGVPGNDPSARI